MKFGVVTFPGSNCDYDSLMSVKENLGEQVEYIWHKETSLGSYDCIWLPGGFSYGDYLRTGAIARYSPVMKAVMEFAQRGGLVIGICNGFQILLESGLLPGAMLRNKSLRFVCNYVYLRCENSDTPFSNQSHVGDVLKIPVAHSDGHYYADDVVISQLRENNQIVYRYCTVDGELTEKANFNGSSDSIAGICNTGHNVFGMMPHPERAVDMILGSDDGLKVLRSIVAHRKSGVAV